SVSRILKWVTGSFEAILAIPLIGASIVVGSVYIALAVMLILHIITLVLTKRDGGKTVGSILGIVTSCIAWIPFVGFIMHILRSEEHTSELQSRFDLVYRLLLEIKNR